jgi:hypothetical protein
MTHHKSNIGFFAIIGGSLLAAAFLVALLVAGPNDASPPRHQWLPSSGSGKDSRLSGLDSPVPGVAEHKEYTLEQAPRRRTL